MGHFPDSHTVEKLTWLFAINRLRAEEVFDVCCSVSMLEREIIINVCIIAVFKSFFHYYFRVKCFHFMLISKKVQYVK